MRKIILLAFLLVISSVSYGKITCDSSYKRLKRMDIERILLSQFETQEDNFYTILRMANQHVLDNFLDYDCHDLDIFEVIIRDAKNEYNKLKSAHIPKHECS